MIENRNVIRWTRSFKLFFVLVLSVMSVLHACSHDTGSAVSGGDAAATHAEAGGSAASGGGAGDRRLKIVTTVYPPFDFARAIGGEYAEVRMLLAPGMESHTYEPTPSDIKMIAEADLFLYTGSENDVWVDRVVPQNVRRLAMMNVVPLLNEEHDHSHDHGTSGDDHGVCGHDHGACGHDHARHPDEHVWTSPSNAILIVRAISAEMEALLPECAQSFQANAEAYIAELNALIQDYKEVVSHAKHRTVLFADRFPFRYLAHEFGLEFEAAFSGCSTETEVSAAVIAELIDDVREKNLPAVFTMEFSNDGIAKAIAEPTGAKILQMHSVHNLSKGEIEAGESYLSLMRKNLEALKEALGSK